VGEAARVAVVEEKEITKTTRPVDNGGRSRRFCWPANQSLPAVLDGDEDAFGIMTNWLDVCDSRKQPNATYKTGSHSVACMMAAARLLDREKDLLAFESRGPSSTMRLGLGIWIRLE